MYNYTLKYRNFDELLSDVIVDFPTYKLADLIEPQQMIKVVKRVNYDLGLRIQKTKEVLLEVENKRVKLPDDFNVLNHALICDQIEVCQTLPQGTHLEDVPVYNTFPTTINSCGEPTVNCNTTVCGCNTTPCTCSCGTTCSSLLNTCSEPDITTTTTTTETIVETKSCVYTLNLTHIGRYGGPSYGTIEINDTTYTYDTTFSYQNFVDYLNSLNLGTFTLTVIDAKFITITVEGTGNYSTMVIVCKDGTELQYNPVCTVIRTDTVTSTTINNTATQQCCPTSPDPCSRPRVFMNCQNECYEVVQYINESTIYSYKILIPLQIKNSPQSIECDCANLYIESGVYGWIQDGYLFTNFDSGKVYVNYQGLMEDDKGNLMVPDHDGLNEYYEYALKQRILENLMFSNKPVANQLQYVEMKLKIARKEANTLVNTPNFAELKQVWEMNRKAQYAKYYNMFKSYNTINGTYVENYLRKGGYGR